MFTDQKFRINGQLLPYWHLGSWGSTERAVEIPIAFSFLGHGAKVLEIGNVTRHHNKQLNHMVIDLNEHSDWENYENADVLTYEPSEAYDLVLSISTLEHTLDVVTAIHRVLTWSPRALITIPLGYNTPGATRTDDAVFDNYYDADISVLHRLPQAPYKWHQISVQKAKNIGFDGFRYGKGFEIGASAIAIILKG